jgi:hypothetical protein
MLIHASISYSNELMSLTQKHSKFCFVLQNICFFPYFYDVLSLGANKGDLLHVIDCIISLLPSD